MRLALSIIISGAIFYFCTDGAVIFQAFQTVAGFQWPQGVK